MNNKSILLVNKDTEIMSAFSIALGEIGYTVIAALDKETAMSELQQKIDLVIIDFSDDNLEPSEILDHYYNNYRDIPRIALFNKIKIDKKIIRDIYKKTFDVIINPTKDFDDLKRRINRAIDNYNLIVENKNYQSTLIDKNFKTGIINIMSSMLNRFDNYIDQFLAEIFIWKEKFNNEFKNVPEINDEFDNFIDLLRDKIINLEEIIQINDILLKQPYVGLDLNIVLGDIIRVMEYIFDKDTINIVLSLGEIKNIKIDSLKIVHCIYYVIEDAIESYKNTNDKEKLLKITTKMSTENDTEWINITFEDTNTIDNRDKNDEISSLFDIKKYISMINGEFNTECEKNSEFTRKTTIKLPTNKLTTNETNKNE